MTRCSIHTAIGFGSELASQPSQESSDLCVVVFIIIGCCYYYGTSLSVINTLKSAISCTAEYCWNHCHYYRITTVVSTEFITVTADLFCLQLLASY
jgi:hypothetical protein